MPSSLESVIWVTVAGGVFGLVGLCVRAVTKSNCKQFSCCFGIMQCSRMDTDSNTNNKRNEEGDDKSTISFDSLYSKSPSTQCFSREAQCDLSNLEAAMRTNSVTL